MQFLCVLLLALNSLPAVQPQSGTVVFSASRTNPYVGEVIELKLAIRTIPGSTPLNLVVPGLTPEELWQLSFSSWLHQNRRPPKDTLVLRLRSTLLFAPAVGPGEYLLSWKLLIRSPSDEENPFRRIGPVRVGSMSSNTLTLEIQRPPLPSPSATVWDLGVGQYRTQAAWHPPEVALGEETTLNLIIEGNGALGTVAPPTLRKLPGWDGNQFLLEPMQASWLNGKRLFRYQVRPRYLRATVPPLFIRFFDPQRGTTVTQPVDIPPLRILAAKDARTIDSGSSVADAWKQLPEFRQNHLKQHIPDPWASWYGWLLWIPLAWAGIVISRMAMEQFAPRWLEQRRWRQAGRQALRTLEQHSVPAHAVRQALSSYLSSGLDRPVAADWETFSSLAPLAPTNLQPVLAQLQLREFGPEVEQMSERLLLIARQAFQAQETNA